MDFNHVTVLLKETVDGLNIRPDGIYVDGTLGGGGHAELICSQLTTGRLIGVDQDEYALKAATERLLKYQSVFTPYHDNFSNIKNVLRDLGIKAIDGLLLDLGVSSHQLDTAERGFSYMNEGYLDMRMDRTNDFSAFNVVNEYDDKALMRILREYGEEKFAGRIARGIVKAREDRKIETTAELVEIIRKAMPGGGKLEAQHPAKRTFQAIRIEVNNELGIISDTLKDTAALLNPKGRMSIITFHSLEDRIVKNTFRDLSTGCICPPEMPICVCNNKPITKLITKKPMEPSPEELELNPRARSAKLRIAEKI